MIFFKIAPSIGTAKGIHGAKKQGIRMHKIRILCLKSPHTNTYIFALYNNVLLVMENSKKRNEY